MINKLRLKFARLAPGLLLILAGLMLSRIFISVWRGGGVLILSEPNAAILAAEIVSAALLVLCGSFLCIKSSKHS